MYYQSLNTLHLNYNENEPIVFTSGRVYHLTLIDTDYYECIDDMGRKHEMTGKWLRDNFVEVDEYTNEENDCDTNDPETRYWKNVTTCAERFSYDDWD